jgi:hypothetical protein
VDPLGGAKARDPGAPTINAKKHQRWTPRVMPELENRERPPSTLRNIDGELPGWCQSCRSRSTHKQCYETPTMKSRSTHHQRKETLTVSTLGGARAGDPGAPTINAKKHRRWAPWVVPELVIRERLLLTLRDIDGGPPGRCRSRRSRSVDHQR